MQQTLLNFGEVPSDVKFIQYSLEGILFVICALSLFFANGQSTIQYIDRYVSYSSDDLDFSNVSFNLGINNQSIQLVETDLTIGKIMKYRTDLVKQNFRIPYVILFMYWVLFPLFCWIFVIYSFFRKPKDLNTL